MGKDKNKSIFDFAVAVGVIGLIFLLLSFIAGIIDSNPELGTYIAVIAGILIISSSIFIATYFVMKKIDEKFDTSEKKKEN